MTTLDEPDVRVISAAGDLLGSENLEELGVKGALVKQEGETPMPSLFGAAAHKRPCTFYPGGPGTL